MSTLISRRTCYTGRVQGVGFRYSVKQMAAGFEVVGWVRNLDDGRVEMQVSGDQNEVNAFLDAISKSHLAMHIRQVEHLEVESPADRGKGFVIRH